MNEWPPATTYGAAVALVALLSSPAAQDQPRPLSWALDNLSGGGEGLAYIFGSEARARLEQALAEFLREDLDALLLRLER